MSCDLCPAGYFCPDGPLNTTTMAPCPIGTFNQYSLPGITLEESVCFSCPDGESTITSGSFSSSQCVCDVGYYYLENVGIEDRSCILCAPENFDDPTAGVYSTGLSCPFKNMSSTIVTAAPAYFLVQEENGFIDGIPCINPHACLGGTAMCDESAGYYGFLCASCHSGYYLLEQTAETYIFPMEQTADCVLCSWTDFFWIFLPIILIATYSLLIYPVSRDRYIDLPLRSSVTRLIANHYQLIAIIWRIFPLNDQTVINLADQHARTFLTDIFLLSEFSYGGGPMACFFFINGVPRPVNTLLCKLYFISAVAIATACAVKFDYRKSMVALSCLGYLLYPGILLSFLDLFSCLDVPETNLKLFLGDFNFTCYGPAHLSYLYGLGIPTFLLLLLLPFLPFFMFYRADGPELTSFIREIFIGREYIRGYATSTSVSTARAEWEDGYLKKMVVFLKTLYIYETTTAFRKVFLLVAFSVFTSRNWKLFVGAFLYTNFAFEQGHRYKHPFLDRHIRFGLYCEMLTFISAILVTDSARIYTYFVFVINGFWLIHLVASYYHSEIYYITVSMFPCLQKKESDYKLMPKDDVPSNGGTRSQSNTMTKNSIPKSNSKSVLPPSLSEALNKI